MLTALAHDLAHVTPEGAITQCGQQITFATCPAVWPPPDRCTRCAAISRRHINTITTDDRRTTRS